MPKVPKIRRFASNNYPHILKICSLLAVGRKFFKHAKIEHFRLFRI